MNQPSSSRTTTDVGDPETRISAETRPAHGRAPARTRFIAPRPVSTVTRAAGQVTSRLRDRFGPRATPPPVTVDDQRGPLFGVTVDDAARRLLLDGEFDLAAVERFAAAASSLTVGRRGDVLVDLQALRFIDASGLGALVALRTTLERDGHRLDLRDARPSVARVFAVGGLSELLPASR